MQRNAKTRETCTINSIQVAQQIKKTTNEKKKQYIVTTYNHGEKKFKAKIIMIVTSAFMSQNDYSSCNREFFFKRVSIYSVRS